MHQQKENPESYQLQALVHSYWMPIQGKNRDWTAVTVSVLWGFGLHKFQFTELLVPAM